MGAPLEGAAVCRCCSYSDANAHNGADSGPNDLNDDRADEPAEQRQKLHERARGAVFQSDLPGGSAHGVRGDARKRLRAERGRVNAEEEMLHRAVAAENELPEIVREARHSV